jgi:threonine dehydrogenase-like Zn-dependent dehydrogenase
MLALRISNSSLSLDELPRPSKNGEAVVRVIKSGICGTDIELVKGYSGFMGTPGHEFVGVVENAPQNSEFIGRRVVGEINAGCGECALCLSGDARHCPTRTVLGIVGRDGAHAEFLRLPIRNLFEVPPSISDQAAVFVEPLAAALAIKERVSLPDNESIAVIGDGKLGILCARSLAAATTNEIVLFGKHEEKMSLVSGPRIKVDDVRNAAASIHSFDLAVEASGSEAGFETALQIVRPRGTIVLKSTFHGKAGWDASRVVVNEVTVVGSRCGRFEPAIQLLASNQIEVADLISDEFPLSQGVKAFDRASTKGVLKVMLSMNN